MKSAHTFLSCVEKSGIAYIWCVNALFNGEVFSLTEQLVDICLSDESNDFLFRNEDDQTKIMTDRFLLIHSIIAVFLSMCIMRWP